MKKLRLLLNFMQGYRLKYAASILATGLSALFSVIIPLVIKLSVDSIIGTKPITSSIMNRLVQLLGGREYLLENLWILGLVIILLTLFNGLFMYLKGKWSSQAAENIAKKFKDNLYETILRAKYNFYSKYQSGDIIQRCTSDVETIRNFLANQFVEIGRTIILLSLILIIMFSIDVKFAFVSTLIVPIIFVFALWFFTRVQQQFKKSDEAEAELSTVIQENITGVRVVKAFAREEFEIEKFAEKNRKYRDLTYNLIKLFANYWSFSDCLCMIQTALVVLVGSYFAATGKITLGTLIVFTSYEGMLLWPVRQMGRILSDMGKTIVSLTRINELLREEKEDLDEGIKDFKVAGNIEFKDVTFGFERDNPILKDVSFKIESGKTVALFGSTGSGKSTIISLLLRLYDYDVGSIKIDGVELREISKRFVRKIFGVVPQDAFLYSKTLRENIAITKPHASLEEIHGAAEIASVHDTILEFEDGYETLVGEKGITLSGGQRQRVTIARTVLNDYSVLVFDDSLSAVDTETELKIRRALKERSKETTTIIISHRITSVKDADLIIVMDKGKVTNIGNHEKLINEEGLYKKVWDIQSSIERDFENAV
ncbi:putative multidrug export ATP-binding/permease protein [Caloramator mitchellensis]|uniref:Putative multidrug export ATP-binding/permease protein n=1 Tax=Caloramator mitchellensis TaxID=908809 RepID=A0A0R3JRX2_CALMK|nr:ABC transporter ATP-binding protein [Caloramator mitchellensis]KRQ86251.1 putative multidrug export ATP-binding/permease protein [Caloramator mitchellensis]